MDGDLGDLLNVSHFESWLPEYLNRGQVLKGRLGDVITPVLQSLESNENFGAALPRLRQLRTDFEPRFCLFLHPTRMNPELANVFDERYGSDRVDAALAELPDVARVMTIVLILLDFTAGGVHLVMLERQSEAELLEDGPLRIPTPTELWEGVFRSLAELSHVIIAVAGISVGLQAEINYLAEKGLDGRLLITDGARLYWRDPHGKLKKSWHLANLRRAVAYASAQPVRLIHTDDASAEPTAAL